MRLKWFSRIVVASAAILIIFDCADCSAGDMFKYFKRKKSKSSRRKAGAKSEAPCVWVKTLEEAKAAASATRPIYIYFSTDVSELNLPSQFRHDTEMQSISQNEAVFYQFWVPEELTPEDKEELRKYGVTGAGGAVITDPAGKPMKQYAETRSAKRLSKQLKGVCEKIKKMEEMAVKKCEMAEKALEAGHQRTAVSCLQWVVDNCSGTPEAEGSASKLEEINKQVGAELKAIIDGEDDPKAKKLKLMKLRTKTAGTLSVYKQITAAMKRL